MTQISETEFYRDYRPITNPRDGSDQWEWYEVERAGIPLERTWSAVEGDNNSLVLNAGYSSVNLLYRMVTEEPWKDISDHVVLVDEYDVCSTCGSHEELNDTCLEEGECRICCPDWADHDRDRITEDEMSLAHRIKEEALAENNWCDGHPDNGFNVSRVCEHGRLLPHVIK